ncbi:MAG: aminotransferase class I/II-fold pyridoxal phosphate-dependent enzyme [Vicinamibacterales bacterium]
MRVEPFAMERFQSIWEHRVRINLSESGVRPLTVRELVGDASALDAVLDQPLVYTQTNGTEALRTAIAGLYSGAGPQHVEVTNGGAEANFLAAWYLVQPDDEVVVLVPTYMQTHGLVRAFGGHVREWPLVADQAAGRWRVDLDHLTALVGPRTRAIVLCTPNNPTGLRIGAEDLDAIATVAARHGCWIVSDEIYRGAERDGVASPSMWGRGERVMVTSGLSKAYGLPGLRVGWVVSTPEVAEALWSYHDYTTIAPGALSDRLARVALAPDTRARLLARTRQVITGNLPRVEDWLAARAARFSWIPSDAGAFVYARYAHPANSTALVTRLRDEDGVLVVPGDQFGMDGYLRIGVGEHTDAVMAGLTCLDALLDRWPATAS